jgi:hypothetical protein
MYRSRVPALLVLVALVALPACREDEPAGGSGGQSVSIESPADGADVTSPIQLTLSATGAEIGPPDTGDMHFHVYVGDSDQYAVVTSTTGSVDASPGEQTIRVVLAQPNHEETSVSTSITVNVTSSTGGGGGGDDGGGGGGGYGYNR